MDIEWFANKGNSSALKGKADEKIILNHMQSSRKFRSESSNNPENFTGFDKVISAQKKSGLFKEYELLEEAFLAMKSDKNVEIEVRDEQIIFRPIQVNPTKAVLFYPGCLVDKRAYAPFAKKLADNGYLVVLGNLDMKDVIGGPAKGIFDEHIGIKDWYVGGHSLGGCLATQVAYLNQDIVRGAIMFASHPIPYFRRTNIKFLDIRATKDKILNDGFANTVFKMNVRSQNVQRVDIVGGNHGNFGYYGEQFADGTAQITRDEQQRIITDKVLEFLKGNFVK